MNKNKILFVIPSLLGVLFFLTPIPWNGNPTIVIGIITAWLKALMGDYGLHVVVGLTVLTSVLTLLGTVLHVRWIVQHPKLKDLFDVPPIWLVIRLLGTAFGLIYLFQVGPDVLTSDAIGGVVFIDIGVNVIPVYIVACLLLPFLTDFGFMEFTGTLARPLFRKVFQLPGRSAVDAITSFVGASSIGCCWYYLNNLELPFPLTPRFRPSNRIWPTGVTRSPVLTSTSRPTRHSWTEPAGGSSVR